MTWKIPSLTSLKKKPRKKTIPTSEDENVLVHSGIHEYLILDSSDAGSFRQQPDGVPFASPEEGITLRLLISQVAQCEVQLLRVDPAFGKGLQNQVSHASIFEFYRWNSKGSLMPLKTSSARYNRLRFRPVTSRRMPASSRTTT
jgi:hypothetical protein